MRNRAEQEPEGDSDERRNEILEAGVIDHLRLGQDVRFLLVCVGGGAARIGREIISRHLRYLETVAINCDPRVQDLEEFDRRVYLGPGFGTATDTGGSAHLGSRLGSAAAPALERIFEGATFVTIVAALGGGTGTGVLPHVLEAAARRSEVISVFLVKPFACEGERRSLAERAMARLHFLDAFVEKQQQQRATVQVLDNESLVDSASQIPIGHVGRRWGALVADHIEEAFVRPAEAAMEATRLVQLTEGIPAMPGPAPPPLAPEPSPGPLPALLPGMPALDARDAEVELTFEVGPESPRGLE